MDESVRVLFIGGYGRSGSTLLDRLLGQVEGVASIGEFRHIWLRSFAEDQLCGCGAPFSKCAFWREVVQEAFGGLDAVDIRAMENLKAHVDRVRYIPPLAMRRRTFATFRRSLFEYTNILQKLYRAIQRVSGCRLIVDSSKDPSHGFVLSRTPGIDLSVVHLVRDSRAVAYSWQRKKLRPEIYRRREYMPQYSTLKSAVEWSTANFLTSGLRHIAKYQLVRYEDLVSDVEGTLTSILSLTGHAISPSLELDADHRVDLRANHTVSGNPMRFVQGPVAIKPDAEWLEKLGAGRRAATTAVTWPWLATYGYFRR